MKYPLIRICIGTLLGAIVGLICLPVLFIVDISAADSPPDTWNQVDRVLLILAYAVCIIGFPVFGGIIGAFFWKRLNRCGQ